MNQAETLRQAVLDEPNEDGHRLAYADWLEQNGQQERAEFIRTQVVMAQLPPFSPTLVRRFGYDSRRWALEKKQRTLLARHEAEWLGPLAKAVESWSWERGFLKLVLRLDQFTGQAFRAAAQHPAFAAVEGIRLTRRSHMILSVAKAVGGNARKD